MDHKFQWQEFVVIALVIGLVYMHYSMIFHENEVNEYEYEIHLRDDKKTVKRAGPAAEAAFLT